MSWPWCGTANSRPRWASSFKRLTGKDARLPRPPRDSSVPDRLEGRRSGFQGYPGGAGHKADGVIPAAEQEEVEQVRLAKGGRQCLPQAVRDVGVLMESVDGPDEQAVLFAVPARVSSGPGCQRGDLMLVEARAFGEERHVDTPFVLAAAAGARPVDHNLPVAQWERQRPAQLVRPPTAHRLSHRQIPHEGAEQGDRRDT